MEPMTFPELTKVVLQKVQELEPENATKIVGYLLLDDYAEQEITQLAFGPDDMIKSFIDKTKEALNLSPKTTTSNHDSPPKDKKQVVSSKLPTKFTPFVPSSSIIHTPAPPRADNAIVDVYVPMYQPLTNYNFEFVPLSYMEQSSFHYQPQFLSLEDKSYNMAYSFLQPNQELAWQPRPHQWSPSIPGMCFCGRFRKGYCKFDCEWAEKDCNVSHGSIKKLEKELVDILKSERAVPLPVMSLPALYQKKYGKVIHGMNDLLLYMIDTIHTIERPNGELCVILAEDFPKYMKSIDDKYKQEQSFSTSCQVYITFSPHSSFTKEDVYQYFNNFGPVESVRIPFRLKRMYGFVVFVYPESVTAVLTKGNPHFVCGMRVLVKPYRDKQECNNRKSDENLRRSIWSPTDTESRRLSNIAAPRASDNQSLPMKQQIEEHEQSVDLKRKNIWEMESSGSSSHNCFSIHALAFPSTSGGVCIDCFGKGKRVSTMTCDYEENRFEELNLPDSPFAYEVAHGDSSINSPQREKDSEL